MDGGTAYHFNYGRDTLAGRAVRLADGGDAGRCQVDQVAFTSSFAPALLRLGSKDVDTVDHEPHR
jgi:hypothetical protein